MRLAIGIISAIINIIGYFPYIKDILKGKVKPHRITWGIWTLLTSIIAVNQVLNKGGYSSLFFISTSFLVLTTFILSIKYGHGGAAKLDIFCLFSALLLLAYWVTLQETRISTLIAISIDVLAFIPTLLKTYKLPDTESYLQWMLAGLGGFLSLLAVPKLDWILIIYPLYIIVANYLIVSIKYFREKFIAAHS